MNPDINMDKLKNIINKNKSFLKKYKIELIVLIGSYGTSDFKHGESDIDIAFLTSSPLEDSQLLSFINEFSSIIKYSNIDLIDLRFASGLLKFEVATKGRLIFEKEEGFFARYSLYCYRYYYDTQKFRNLRREYLEEKLEQLGEL